MRRRFIFLISAVFLLSGFLSFRPAFAADDGGLTGGGGNKPPPTVSIITNVINDDHGSKGPADFTALVSTGTRKIAVTGAGALGAYVILDNGPYAVAAAQDSHYTVAMSGACSGTLEDGQTAVCTIAYDDLGPSATPPPQRCTEDIWNCTDWGPCTGAGTQTRECVMSFNCPDVVTPSPPTSRSCGRDTPGTKPPGSVTPPASVAPPTGTGSATDAEEVSDASATPSVPALPATTTPLVSSAGCPWFWGWFLCYWWILLIGGVALWRVRRSWRQSRTSPPDVPPPVPPHT